MAVAHHAGEQTQLADGAAALTRQARQRQAGFGMGALQQRIAQRHDLVGDGLQEVGAAREWQRAVFVEGRGRQAGGAVHIAGGAEAEMRLGDLGIRGGVEGTLASVGAGDRVGADQHLACEGGD